MRVNSLGYVGVHATDTEAWRAFAADVFAMQTQPTAFGLSLRMDDREHRILVHRGEGKGGGYYGWDVGGAIELEDAAGELEAHGVKVRRAQSAELDIRRVAGMLWFEDPLRNRVELFYGLAPASAPFEPPRPLSGFRTGPLGLGHAVLTVPSADAVLPFYRDVLGFRVSDYTTRPFNATFLHVNARHHSLALLETGQAGLHHIMVEVLSLDDVGKAYDAALQRDSVAVTLGRHTNDHVLSFYAWSPSGFLMECGWGGRSIDDSTWIVTEMTDGPSIWGHERSWLGEQKRNEARGLREQAAAAGLRAPLHVSPGEYDEIAPHPGPPPRAGEGGQHG
ncbi:MAG TPA: VOC family protein [Burkholderiales bacterium]|nr:VOC family protein [Burkholderiales bacterium]